MKKQGKHVFFFLLRKNYFYCSVYKKLGQCTNFKRYNSVIKALLTNVPYALMSFCSKDLSIMNDAPLSKTRPARENEMTRDDFSCDNAG